MPWTETVTMQRLEFILACQAGGESMTQLCHRHGISRKTGYKWLSRFNPGELSSLENLSRARHLQPDKIAPDITARLVQFRQQHPDWGPKKSATGSSATALTSASLPPALSATC